MNNQLSKTATSDIKRKQQKRLVFIIILCGVIGWGVLMLMSPAKLNDSKEKSQTISTQFSSPLHHVNENNVLLEKTQNSLASTEKKTDSLQQQLALLTQTKTEQVQKAQMESEKVQTLENQLQVLEQRINQMEQNISVPKEVSIPSSSIAENTLQLTSPQISTADKSPHNYVPTGTFVKAVMLGGADTSAGVNSQSNPIPVLFRIIEAGTLPNHQRSHLKDCLVTAAAIGDISSERGQMRLENLSCVRPKGKILDIPVEGTVFGPEGKNGVRGTPLWREGMLLKRAFMAGSLSGLSQTISAQAAESLNPVDLLKQSTLQGTSNSMEKLADYHIRRADQYHPVIQIQAGTVVDIVFLKGFFLEGKSEESNAHLSNPLFEEPIPLANTLSVNTQPNTLPLTPQQIEALKRSQIPVS